VTIVASPNNPTGNAFPPSDLEALIEGSRGAVILDAAYAEYGGSDYSSLVGRYDNVAVMGTFSKAHGLAGLRVGYVLVPQALAGRVAECRPPYALSTVAEAVALASLRYQEFVRESVALALDGKAALSEALTSMGFNVYPSDANFLLARPPVDALQLQSALRSRGILVRAFPDRPGLRDHLRITVGLPSHQERLLAELKAILGGGE
jgi:histidinol-phosphate aminotransferase